MVLNDPCDPGYVTDTLGEGQGSLWEASGKPQEPPGVIASGVRQGPNSAVHYGQSGVQKCTMGNQVYTSALWAISFTPVHYGQ